MTDPCSIRDTSACSGVHSTHYVLDRHDRIFQKKVCGGHRRLFDSLLVNADNGLWTYSVETGDEEEAKRLLLIMATMGA